MTYKTILVCLNEVARNPVLLKLAGDIAARQSAHVVGLYVLPAVRIYPAVGPGVFAEVVEEFRESFKSRSAEVRRGIRIPRSLATRSRMAPTNGLTTSSRTATIPP